MECAEGLTCFTIMPSGSHEEYEGGTDEAGFVYQHIIRRGIEVASERLGTPIRSAIEVDRNRPGSITRSIIRSLASSDFVIADLTGGNANVFLELGIRYALCPSNTILLRQKHETLPFDIANFKAVSYLKYRPEKAAESIADFIVNSRSEPQVDSPVFEAIGNLVVDGDEVNKSLHAETVASGVMPWAEIMQRISTLRFYEEQHTSGSFIPDAILGITNGGMIVAEIISRKYFRKVPVLCLWADRWSPKAGDALNFFTNPYARAAIEPLRPLAAERALTLLVVDDNIASGNTCQHAVRFLKDELGDGTRIVFQPIVCKETAADYLSTIEEFLAPAFNGGLFKLENSQFIANLLTSKNRFPYDKDIRG
jgi:hypoxanthine phosphoribosyltransferase